MLQNIRAWAEGWLAWIIVILIIIPFALWGINQYFGGGNEVPVATVNGTDIGQREVDQAYQRQRQRLAAVLGDRFDERGLRQQVLDEIVNQLVLMQGATKTGLRVGDAQLAAQINSIEAFQRNGQFDPALYEQALHSQGLSPQRFEQQVRQSALIGQFEAGIVGTSLVTPTELANMAKLKEQRREISYLIVPAAKFTSQAVVTDQDIQRYYTAHQAEFVSPEQVSIEYLDLKLDDLAASAAPPDEESLRKTYQERRAEFTTEEQRRASHILVSVDQGADQEAVKQAKDKAEALLARVKKGEPFDTLAREASQDPGSAKQGGDLGFFGRGVMDKAFEDAVFTMNPGDLRLVRTPFGFHIIKLTEVKPAAVKPFSEVRDQLAREERRHQVEKIFLDKGETMANLTYEHPDTLEPAAKALGLPIKASEPFTRSGATGDQDITANPKVIEAAFSEDVLGARNNSQPIELSSDHFVVLRIKDHKPAAPRPLQEVRAEIEQRLRAESARSQAAVLGRDLLGQLRQGKDPNEVANAQQLKWEPPVTIKRDEQKLNPLLTHVAFSLPRAQSDKPAYGDVTYPSGDFVIVKLLKVEDGSIAAVDGKARQGLQQELAQAYGDGELRGMVKDIKAKADIKLHPDRL